MTWKVLPCIVSVIMQLFSTITSKGQVLIPVSIRKSLNIKSLDRLTFKIIGSKILVEKAASTDEMLGFVKSKVKFTDQELETAIKEATEQELSQTP